MNESITERTQTEPGAFPALAPHPMAGRGSLVSLPWERSLSNLRRDARTPAYIRSERPASVYAARLVLRERGKAA